MHRKQRRIWLCRQQQRGESGNKACPRQDSGLGQRSSHMLRRHYSYLLLVVQCNRGNCCHSLLLQVRRSHRTWR